MSISPCLTLLSNMSMNRNRNSLFIKTKCKKYFLYPTKTKVYSHLAHWKGKPHICGEKYGRTHK